MEAINIYQMYMANGKKLGFYVKRHGWANTVVKVTQIKGIREGDNLPEKPPYYGNLIVYGEFYWATSPEQCTIRNFKNRGVIRCAGTYGYTMLETPINNGK